MHRDEESNAAKMMAAKMMAAKMMKGMTAEMRAASGAAVEVLQRWPASFVFE
jgi:hypothetical protein